MKGKGEVGRQDQTREGRIRKEGMTGRGVGWEMGLEKGGSEWEVKVKGERKGVKQE